MKKLLYLLLQTKSIFFFAILIFIHFSERAMDMRTIDQYSTKNINILELQLYLQQYGGTLFEPFYHKTKTQKHYTCYKNFLKLLESSEYPPDYLTPITYSNNNFTAKIYTTWPFITLLYDDEKTLHTYIRNNYSLVKTELFALPTHALSLGLDASHTIIISPLALALSYAMSEKTIWSLLVGNAYLEGRKDEEKRIMKEDPFQITTQEKASFFTNCLLALMPNNEMESLENFLLFINKKKFDPQQESTLCTFQNGKKINISIKNSLLAALTIFMVRPEIKLYDPTWDEEIGYTITKTVNDNNNHMQKTTTTPYTIATVKHIIGCMLNDKGVFNKKPHYLLVRKMAGTFITSTLLNAHLFEEYYTTYSSNNLLTKQNSTKYGKKS
jgi:hypothetical protein